MKTIRLFYIFLLSLHITLLAPYLVSSASTFNVFIGILILIFLIYKTIKTK